MTERRHVIHGYGSFCGGDPRDFRPDPDCSTEKERANHQRDCALWDARENDGKENQDKDADHKMVSRGDAMIHIAFSSYGLGTYKYYEDCMGDDCCMCREGDLLEEYDDEGK